MRYAPEILDASWIGAPATRELFEYWGHMASLMPFEMHPLLRWRMAAAAENHKDNDTRVGQLNRSRPGFMQSALDEIRERGALSAREITGAGASRGGWWGWSDGKRAVEALFAAGKLAAAGRRGFERVYDLPERVIPARVLAMPTPAIEDAQRALMRIAASALGVGTEKDLCDYFRIRVTPGKQRITELVETGELIPVGVEGWLEPAYVHRDAKSPRKLDARALLSPFDSLIWERARTERIFGFRYRIEIYTPSAKRKYGYYVLPFLARRPTRRTHRFEIRSRDWNAAREWSALRTRRSTEHSGRAAYARAGYDGVMAWPRANQSDASRRPREKTSFGKCVLLICDATRSIESPGICR